MPMRFQRRWDFDPGNKQLDLNSLTQDDEVIAALQTAINQAMGDQAELIRDTIAAALVQGANITITPNDGANTITISGAEPGLSAEGVMDLLGSGGLVEGANIDLTYDDIAGTLTIASTASGGGAAGVGGKTPSPAAYDSLALARGPLGYWKMDDAAGTVADDATANNRDGNYAATFALNQPSLLADNSGKSVDFSAGGEAVVPYGAWMNASPNWSFEALINADALTANHSIACRHGTAAGSMWLLRVDAGVLKLYLWRTAGTGGGFVSVGTAPIGVGKTYHVAATYDGATGRLYVDGQLRDTLAATMIVHNQPLTIAGWDGAGVGWEGRISRAALYDRVLSAAEILQSANAARISAAGSIVSLVDLGPAGVHSGTIVGSMTDIPGMSIVVPEGNWLISGDIWATNHLARGRLVKGSAPGTSWHTEGGFIQQGDASLRVHRFYETPLYVPPGTTENIIAQWAARDSTVGMTILRKMLVARPY